MADLAAALELEDLPNTARKALKKLYHYLDKHQNHIQYANFKALGLPLGSGMVESACKWLIQQRFKGIGMRWSEDGFNHLLQLRLAWINDRFDTFFPYNYQSLARIGFISVSNPNEHIKKGYPVGEDR